MSDFTPGPWEARYDEPSDEWLIYSGESEFPHAGSNEANARLIAAAPELYEALKHPGDFGLLLNLAADIIEDRGHERHQGIAKRLREKARLELAALALVDGKEEE